MGILGEQYTRTTRAAVALVAALAVAVPAERASAAIRQTVVVMTTPSHGAAAERFVRDAGGRVTHELSVIDGFIATVPRTVVSGLAAVPGVRSVTPDRPVHLEALYGQDSGAASAVYSDVVRATKTWGTGDTGAGTAVAVIDTGINTTGDLAGQVVRAVDFTSDGDNLDHYGHGTFVGGLIAGTGAHSSGSIMGVAPGTSLVSLKISGADGATDVTLVLEALEWVKDYASTYNIRVVNLSLGFASQQSYLVDPLDYAVEKLWNSGVVVVTAAGNGGSTGPILAPGNDPFVVTVGAINDRTTVTSSDDYLASFSSVGPTADALAKPDVLAPGRSVVSSRSPGSTVDLANPTSEIGDVYARASGTSFSTAIVSGVAALILSRSPWLTPNQVKLRLMSTARALPGGNTPGTGAGVVDAFGATMSTSTASANVSAVPAVGGGSLQATRGPACLRDSTGNCMTDADANAVLGYDPNAYWAPQWSQSEWVGSQWVGSQWVGSQWVGSQWVGSQWVGSQWVMAAAS
ncbi:MAG TPA: S8 family peptidase [Mycobacteriales bacterium]|nr:S8 family peptidase [Mycobacteriales bacterium]